MKKQLNNCCNCGKKPEIVKFTDEKGAIFYAVECQGCDNTTKFYVKKNLAIVEWNCKEETSQNIKTPNVGDLWYNPKEKQTKVLLAVSAATEKEPCFAALQVLESGCVYNEYFLPEEHIYLGKSACDLKHLFEVNQ